VRGIYQEDPDQKEKEIIEILKCPLSRGSHPITTVKKETG